MRSRQTPTGQNPSRTWFAWPRRSTNPSSPSVDKATTALERTNTLALSARQNVNQAPTTQKVGWTPPHAQTAQGLAYYLLLNKITPISNNWVLSTKTPNKNGSSAPLMHGVGLQVSRIHAALACTDNTSTDHHPIVSILFLLNTAIKNTTNGTFWTVIPLACQRLPFMPL